MFERIDRNRQSKVTRIGTFKGAGPTRTKDVGRKPQLEGGLEE